MKVVSFYRFVDIEDAAALSAELQPLCERAGLLGTILVAEEGVNGTLAGEGNAVQAVLDGLQALLGLESPLAARWTDAVAAPFRRMKVRIKTEIVALGRREIQPQHKTGKHVLPRDWNNLIDNPETLIIDTRNHYEVEVGTFPRAIDPGTDSFRQFPDFAAQLSAEDRERPVAMFCTGGIRCEKASALLLELGFTDVHQLQGGILNYLEQMSGDDDRWQGDCFVFDSRVTVDRDLAEGGYVQCHACRRPLSVDDLGSPDYREGMSCPHCIDEVSPADGSRRLAR
ncbi:MAG: rhodanese-related sulfurtransferase [Woeseiaceae bacterium]